MLPIRSRNWLARPGPVTVRLALRDLGRYRARSGSALSAISLGVFIVAIICVLAAQRCRFAVTGPGAAGHSFLATSGPVMRASSGKVAAMMPRAVRIPPAVMT